jgi:hypothetical protein
MFGACIVNLDTPLLAEYRCHGKLKINLRSSELAFAFVISSSVCMYVEPLKGCDSAPRSREIDGLCTDVSLQLLATWLSLSYSTTSTLPMCLGRKEQFQGTTD